MKNLIGFFLLFSGFFIGANAQTYFYHDAGFRWGLDSVKRGQFKKDLNQFLIYCDMNAESNARILPEELNETAILTDEMEGLGLQIKIKDSLFYRCKLLQLVKVNDSNFTVQLAYIGIHRDTPMLRAVIKMNVKYRNNQFYFYSQLHEHTKEWKSLLVKQHQIFYKDQLNKKSLTSYLEKITFYDRKLRAPDNKLIIYSCAQFNEVMELVGIEYYSDYQGYTRNSLSHQSHGIQLSVNGISNNFNTPFDPHDLWHARLQKVVQPSTINRPVDEGVAYLYGGSWGISWDSILYRFKQFSKNNPTADWLKLYQESKNFDPTSTYPLNVDFVINALIVQQLEKQSGFEAVMKLVQCGKKQPDNENYFKTLKALTGIDQQGFSAYVNGLLAL